MAGNKLSLAIAINLLTENFKKGKNNVVSGLKSMQVRVMTFIAALGFGSIGLSNFVSKLISVAKETSRVTTALKNVSGGLANYAANQKFVNELAAKYGLEVNALTSNFAKFTASATAGGMALENQKKIFESVSRASTAFALSAEDTNSVFLALSQMMGKGKIASQELRLQMGEKLPVAIQAMANGLGVSISEMEKMMAKGELIANDVLPKFADALNALTPSVDLDNINTSLNKMSNAFGDLTTNLGVESKFKKIVDGVTSVMQSAANNIKRIFSAVFLGIFFIATHNVVKIGKAWDALAMAQVDGTKKLHAKLIAAEVNKEAELVAVQKARLQHEMLVGATKIKNEEKLRMAEKKFGMAVLAEEEARIAYAEGASVKKVGIATRGMNIIKVGAAKLGLVLKSLWTSFAPAVIISGLVSIVMYFKNMYSEAKRIKSIFSDYKEEANASSSTAEVVKLKTLQNLYNDNAKSEKERKIFRQEIISILGIEIGKEEDLNDVIRDRIKLLEQEAKVAFYTNKKIEAQDKFNEAAKKLDLGGMSEAEVKEIMMGYHRSIESNYTDKKSASDATGKLSKYLEGRGKHLSLELFNLAKSIAPVYAVIDDIQKELDSATSDIITSSSQKNKGNNAEDGDALKKLESKYAQSLRELDVKLQAKFITEADYQKALEDLIKSSYVEAKSSTDKAVLESKYLKNLENAVLGIKKADELQLAVNEAIRSHTEEETKLTNLKTNGIILEEDYNEKMVQLIDKTITQIGSMSDLTDANKEYIKTLQQAKDKIKKPLPTKNDYEEKKEKRDTTFDYKKSKSDILAEELDIAKRNYATLKELASNNLAEFGEELNKVANEVPSLEQAFKIQKVKEDVKELGKEVTSLGLSTADGLMNGADGIVNSINRINEAFSNPDASGWEQIMAIWDGLMSTIDSFMQIVETIQKLSEVTKMLSAAKQAEFTQDTMQSSQRIAQQSTETASYVANKQIETTADMTKTAAGSTAAYASIPWVGVALAAASIAAMFALIPKFKDGGIIGGGATSGDQMLARVNAGEMILNKPQQGNLWKMLNSTSRVRGESLEVGGKVRGADIFLSLKNYMRSTGKTL